MSNDHTIIIRFPGLNAADANNAAAELRRLMIDEEPANALNISQTREATDTQDMGGALTVIFGTPAAVAIASGLKAWLTKRGTRESRVEIVTPAGQVLATGSAADGIDVAEAVKALTRK